MNESIESYMIGHPNRGVLPAEFVFVVTRPDGTDDMEAGECLARHVATVAYTLGFDTAVMPRRVAGQRAEGYVLHVTERRT